MPEGDHGAKLSNLDYAPLCEVMGTSPLLSEATNCSAPDTGNMEILAQFGTPLQQEQWLAAAARRRDPLVLRDDRAVGRVVGCDEHLEPHRRADGDDYVISGHKWFTSGALDPRCKVAVFMGVTNPDADAHRRQSMILVPMDAPGVTVVRGLPVFGHSEGGGHGETLWDERARPEGEPARRGRRRLRDRAGPPRPRPDSPLHARDRARRTRARPDVHARADARRVRQAARRSRCGARAHRRVANRRSSRSVCSRSRPRG